MSKKAKSIPPNFFLPEYTLERAAEAMALQDITTCLRK